MMRWGGRAACLAVGLVWLAVCVTLIITYRHAIATLQFLDPDDALRLVQVRDLLAGQGWFDLVQHRFIVPEPVVMHWSRFVDLPIAGLIALLGPLVGAPLAERITLVAVPLGLLLGLFVILYRLRLPLGLSRATGVLMCALLATSIPILNQFTPLRIDHHGWQILLGAVALLGLLHPDQSGRKGAAIAGLAMAGWLQVSMEGLPYAVAFGAILALRDVMGPFRSRQLVTYLLCLCAASWIMLPLGRGGWGALLSVCDAVSPALLVPLTLSTAVLLVARSVPLRQDRLWFKALPIGLAGLAGALSFAAYAPACLAGPFETLSPTVYRLWYLGVQEGLPITVQNPEMRGVVIVPALLGFIGAVLAARDADMPQRRRAWFCLLAVQIAAFLVSLDVLRAMSFSHFVALPGNAALLVRLGRAVQQHLRLMPLRVIVTAAMTVLTPIGTASATIAVMGLSDAEGEQGASDGPGLSCLSPVMMQRLGKRAPMRVFAPLDIGPAILANSHHGVVATAHHRNVYGMEEVLRAFTTAPAAAGRIVRGSGADYLFYCAGKEEMDRYVRLAPGGLAAALERGDVPPWLVPVRFGGTRDMHLYHIVEASVSASVPASR